VIKIDPAERTLEVYMNKLDNSQRTIFNIKILAITLPFGSLLTLLSATDIDIRTCFLLVSFYIFLFALLTAYFENRYQEYDAIVKYILKHPNKYKEFL